MGMLNSDIEGSVLLATHEVVQKEREEKLAENVKNRLNIYVQGNKKDFLFAGEIKRNLSSCVNFLMQEYSTLPPILSNDGQVHEKQCPRNCATLFHSSGVFCLSWTPHTW